MSRIPSASPEVGVIRTYVDWLVGLPWNVATDDQLDIKEAAKILDEDHYGLEKIKERILEYLAVRTLADTIRSPILAFVGPPGVGKTSLGKSIARAMGRKFVRMSLGGIHDEAEIRGHRRTYIGALPGRIIQNIKTAGTNNPVFMLDEVDKIGMDFRGDPSSRPARGPRPGAEQHLPGQLPRGAVRPAARCCSSRPATCSTRSRPPLRDRMEIIQLPGYTAAGEDRDRQAVPHPQADGEPRPERRSTSRSRDEAMVELVQAYTHEAGVRNLEREIANIMRKVARHGRRGSQAQDRRRRQEARRVPRAAAVRVRRARARGPDRLGDRPGRDRGRRRRRRDRGHPDGGQGGLHPHRPARRGDARVRPGRACRGSAATRPSSASSARSSRRTPSTSTCRPAAPPRTARPPGSRWPPRWSARSPASPSARTWR